MPLVRTHRSLLFAAIFLLAPALAKTDASAQYRVDHWTTADGLPVNGINRVLAARSGYLWLATFDGLVRFDGHSFEVYRAGPQHPGLPGNRIVDLVETDDEHLWLLTEDQKLARFDGQRFHALGAEHGLADRLAHLMIVDDNGVLWVELQNGLARRIAKNRFERLPGSEALGRIHALRATSGRDVVIAASNGLNEFRDGRLWRHRGAESGIPLPTRAIGHDRAGNLWVGGADRLVRSAGDDHFELVLEGLGVWKIHAAGDGVAIAGGRSDYRVAADGQFTRTRRAARFFGTGHETIQRQADDGSIWRNGLDRLERNDVAVFQAPCTINDFVFDGQGGAWVATSCSGLYRVWPSAIDALTRLGGVTLGSTYGLAETSDGRLWIGTLDHGVAAWSPDGTVQWLDSKNDIAHIGVHALWAGPDDELWIGGCRMGAKGCRMPADMPPALGRDADIRAVHRDRNGSLWVGGRELWKHSDTGGWQSMMTASGLSAGIVDGVRVIIETRDGSLWFGTHASGLLRRDMQGRFQHYGTSDGLSSDSIRALREDHSGKLWIATEDRGLCRLAPAAQPPDIACMDSGQGLWSDSLNQVLLDDRERLWLSSNQGIFVLQLAALNAVLDGRRARVHPQVYTERHGLPSRETNGGVAGAGIRLRDGRFAVPTQNGVALFHPDDLQLSSPPARAVIEEIALPDGRRLPAADKVRLPPGARSFVLHYTGLGAQLTAPLYFRYRLLPEQDWHELGSARQLSLTQLAPGAHRLELIAFDAGGIAGPSAQVELSLPAYWYETAGFRYTLLTTLVLLGLMALAYRYRVTRQRRELLEQTVSTRTAELSEALDTVHEQHDEIVRLAASKTRFFANVSHELRTPLSLLAGPIDDLAQGRPPSARLVSVMQHSVHRLERLINQLLDLERLDARRFPLDVQRLDLSALAMENIRAFTPLAKRAGIDLEASRAFPRAWTCGDREQLVRVIANLLSNALKLCPAGGQVRLDCGVVDAAIKLSVDDSGPGIQPDRREAVFDRFAQMHNVAAGLHKGTGLGLALSREIAALHGGQLYASDSRLGGACFVFHLPLANSSPLAFDVRAKARPASAGERIPTAPGRVDELEPQTASATAQSTSSLPPGAEQPLVLLVEDHAPLREYLAEILAQDYRVLTASDGKDGLRLASDHLPDLVVTDMMMPRLDGHGLARELRRRTALAGVPIVFLTARASDADQVAGLDSGADYYLTKPVRRQVLLAQLAAALRACRRLQERYAQQAAEKIRSAPQPTDNISEQLQALLERHAHEPAFAVADLAAGLHMSESKLRRTCQKLSALTPGELLRQHRLERARRLLAGRQGTVSEVAYAVGYSSLSAFSRAYSEHFGHPPSTA